MVLKVCLMEHDKMKTRTPIHLKSRSTSTIEGFCIFGSGDTSLKLNNSKKLISGRLRRFVKIYGPY